MENAAIELHDSRVTSARVVGTDVVIEMTAYVHVSEGVPGVDAGTGWTQHVRCTIRDADVSPLVEELLISDGRACVDDEVFDNMLPMDVELRGATTVDLTGAEGSISIRGSALRIESLGKRTYVESFEPTAK